MLLGSQPPLQGPCQTVTTFCNSLLYIPRSAWKLTCSTIFFFPAGSISVYLKNIFLVFQSEDVLNVVDLKML